MFIKDQGNRLRFFLLIFLSLKDFSSTFSRSSSSYRFFQSFHWFPAARHRCRRFRLWRHCRSIHWWMTTKKSLLRHGNRFVLGWRCCFRWIFSSYRSWNFRRAIYGAWKVLRRVRVEAVRFPSPPSICM